jgi:hypothetical protein
MDKICSTQRIDDNLHKMLVGKPQLFGKSRRKWKDNIKLDLLEMECGPSLM